MQQLTFVALFSLIIIINSCETYYYYSRCIDAEMLSNLPKKTELVSTGTLSPSPVREVF